MAGKTYWVLYAAALAGLVAFWAKKKADAPLATSVQGQGRRHELEPRSALLRTRGNG